MDIGVRTTVRNEELELNIPQIKISLSLFFISKAQNRKKVILKNLAS